MTKPPVRRRTPPHATVKPRATSVLVPVALAVSVGAVVAGLVWLSGASERARIEAEIEEDARRVAREGDERRARYLTPSERAAIDQRAHDRELSN